MKKYKFLLVASNFYPEITLNLLKGAQQYLEKNGHNFDTTFTKGSLEIPTKISLKLNKRKYDAVVAIGCIIKGDLKYGAKRSNKDGSISLHARNLAYNHPTTKERIDLTAPCPKDPLWQFFEGA